MIILDGLRKISTELELRGVIWGFRIWTYSWTIQIDRLTEEKEKVIYEVFKENWIDITIIWQRFEEFYYDVDFEINN